MDSLNTQILEGLSDNQIKAVTHELKPLLVIAGPGSGKTRVMAHRIPWIVNNFQINPSQILAVTFTNKSAKELMERANQFLPNHRTPLVKTFHGFCSYFLRREGFFIGLDQSFSIYDDADQLRILKNIFDYIENNYKYQKSSVPKSCPDTIVGKVGDCDDFSILFSSIARAAGIPAWLELGIIPAFIDASSGCDLRDWGGHAWVNAVVPLNDGTFTIVNIDLANSYFMWLPPYRISDWVDNGNGDDLDSYYYLFSSKGINSQATYLENSYVSQCEVQGEIKLTELELEL